MIDYNQEENILVMNKVNLPKPIGYDNNVLSGIKDSYNLYKDQTVKEDLQYFFDSVADHYNLYKDKDLDYNRVTVSIQDIKEKSYSDSRDLYAPKKSYYSIECNLYQGKPPEGINPGITDHTNEPNWLLGPFEILKLPFMDSRGVLTIDSSTKVLTNALQAAEGVSYNRKGSEINIQLGERNVKFTIDKSGKFSMRTAKKRKCFIDDAIYGCYSVENIDADKAFEKYSAIHNSAIIRNSAIIDKYDPSAGKSASEKVLKDLYTSDAYKLNATARHELNTACQLDRAIGETLSRDVRARSIAGEKGEMLAHRGEVITAAMVKLFKRNRITTIYIRHKPSLEGMIPYNVKYVNVIAHGTRINSFVRDSLGSSYGYFVNNDIFNNISVEGLENQSVSLSLFTTPGMLNCKGQRFTEEHVEALYNTLIGLENAYDKLASKTHLTAEEQNLLSYYAMGLYDSIRVQRCHSRVNIPLDCEVITNNTFWGPDVDDRFEKAWYVLRDDGTLIKQSEDNRRFLFDLTETEVTPYNGDHINSNDLMAIYSLLGYYALEPESRILYDRDEMLLKKVKTVNDVFHLCFKKAVDSMIRNASNSLRGLITFSGSYVRLDSEKLNKVCYALQKSFYSQLIKDKYVATADTKNPAATLAQVCNITTVVQSSKAVSDEQRLLSFAYASRICPYETPSSGKIGLVNHKAMGCRIDKDGLLLAAYRKIDKSGDVHKVSNTVRWMTVKEACKYNISDLLSLQYIDDSKGLFKSSPVIALVPNESKHGETMVVETIDSYAVDYVYATPEATISSTAMLIPFLGADDTARISFGLSMQKQAIYCLENERPRVLTSMYKDILKYNDYYEIRAKHAGQIESIDDRSITVSYDTKVDTSKTELPGVYTMCDELRNLQFVKRNRGGLLVPKYIASKANGLEARAEYPCTITGFKPVDADGTKVKVLIEPIQLKAITKEYDNVLLTLKPLKIGDTVRAQTEIFSEEERELANADRDYTERINLLAIDNILPYDCTITYIGPTPNDPEMTTVVFQPIEEVYREMETIPCHTVEINQSDCIFMHYDKAVGEYFKEGDVLAHASVIKNGVYSPARNAIVCYMPTGYNYEDAIDMSQDCARHYTAITAHKQTVSVKEFSDFRTFNSGYISEGTPIFTSKTSVHNKAHNVSGYFLNNIYSSENRAGCMKYADARLLAFNNQREGDKMAGRHGNKGVTARICKNSEMPMFMNGRIPDICLNPCGVPSRMNIGQNLEAHLGFVATMLDTYIVSDPFNGASREDIAMLMHYVYELANEDNTDNWKAITAEYGLPQSLCNHAVKNYDYIHEWKGAFNADGTAYMWDPISQRKFANPIAFGVAYFLKLEQEADEKIHARDGMDTSAYVDATQQPSQSRAKGGGQRNGEMELVTLGAYGAVGTLHESMHEKADDVGARYNFSRQMFGANDGFMADDRECVPQANDMLRYLLEGIGVAMDTTDITPEEEKYIKPITREVSDQRVVYNHTDVKYSTTLQRIDAFENARKQLDDVFDDSFLDSL